jgi:hypothetical protein
VIATVRNCFGLEGYLTSRDAAAPDLSCVLTLDVPRTDKPNVHPLKWDTKPDLDHINSLHRIFEYALVEITGEPRPEDKEILTFVAETYEKVFRTRKFEHKRHQRSKRFFTLSHSAEITGED